jgi:hypothetical protein
LMLNQAENTQRALRLSVRTTAFHVVKTGSTPVGRAIFSSLDLTCLHKGVASLDGNCRVFIIFRDFDDGR